MRATMVASSILKSTTGSWVVTLATIMSSASAAASLVFVLALSRGISREVAKNTARWDLDSVLIMGVNRHAGSREGVWTQKELDSLKTTLGPRAEVAVYKFVDVPLLTANGISYAEPRVQACNAAMLRIQKKPLQSGFLFDDDEDKSAERVCLLGSAVRQRLFPQVDPVGAVVSIGTFPFVVKGVFVAEGTASSPSMDDDATLISLGAGQRYFNIADTYKIILIRALPPNNIHDLAGVISPTLRAYHSLGASVEDDFAMTFPDQIEMFYKKLTGNLHRTAILFLAVALVLAAVTASGTAALWVAKRQHEIAVRLAVGATRRRVCLEFLSGAFVLILSGVGLGVLAGALFVSNVPRKMAGMPLELDFGAITFPLIAVVALVGTLSSITVAYRTARLPPASAMQV